MNVKKAAYQMRHLIIKNSPTILTGLAVGGLVTTTVLAVKATPKALDILERNKHFGRQIDDFTNLEIIKLTYKCYIPAAVMGGVTIACIIGANTVNLRRNAALASLYSLSETAMKEYKTKVIETIGEKKEQVVRDELAKDKIKNNPVNDKEIIITGEGNLLCFDAFSGRYFKSDIETIKRVMNHLSRELLSNTMISLNEMYADLGLGGTQMGDMLGWHVDDGLIEAEFSSQLTETGVPCLVLGFVTEPRYIYTD